MKKIHIEFVCSANHGRSPMAEVIAKEYIKQLNLQDKFTITSSGSNIDDEEMEGADFDAETIHRTKVLAEINLTYNNESKYTKLNPEIDYIFVMAQKNLEQVKLIYKDRENKPVISLLDESGVLDAFKGTEDDYRRTRDQIKRAVKKRIDEIIKEHNLNQQKTLTGTCVCPGEAEGTITTYNQEKTYTKKDIVLLNTHMTQNVIKLKDAGAILSAEGGITCHASILARELNVPCLVGVKNLQELKEGTKVKVDTADETILIKE